MVVTLVVLTRAEFRFSFLFSQLLAKAIPVRGAIFREARLRKLKRAFCFGVFKSKFHQCPFPP
ncbi:hypothetical protein ACSJM2_07385 [Serratia marcescens]|uniref:hypothetical protein n=1 Tax=Serratia marcescens TaxID=615 RepID=UPI003EE36096